jgi:hypothetical protein
VKHLPQVTSLLISFVLSCTPAYAFPLEKQRFVSIFLLARDEAPVKVDLLDSRIESAAVTAALIRAPNTLLIVANTQASAYKDAVSKDLLQKRAAEFRGAIDATLESYLRLVGILADDYTAEDIKTRSGKVAEAMGYRGQTPTVSALPVIMLHTQLIRDGSAPSRDDMLNDILALTNK